MGSLWGPCRPLGESRWRSECPKGGKRSELDSKICQNWSNTLVFCYTRLRTSGFKGPHCSMRRQPEKFLKNGRPEAACRDRTQCLIKVRFLENDRPEAACRDIAQCLKKMQFLIFVRPEAACRDRTQCLKNVRFLENIFSKHKNFRCGFFLSELKKK